MDYPDAKTKRFLARTEPWRWWGFVIVRTVYTPESDQSIKAAVSYLKTWIVERVEENTEYAKADSALWNELVTRLDFPIIEDRAALDGASIAVVRDHFRQWQHKQNNGEDCPAIIAGMRACIWFDERTMQDALALPKDDAPEDEPERLPPCFKIVDLNPIGGDHQTDPEKEGLMKCAFSDVWTLMEDLEAMDPFWELVDLGYKDEEGVQVYLETLENR